MSLTSTLFKVLELKVRDQISSFFTPDKLYNNQRFILKFRSGHSCEDLLATLDKWQIAVSKGQSVVVAFLDLWKALDNVRHDVLVQDLFQYPHFGSCASLDWRLSD